MIDYGTFRRSRSGSTGSYHSKRKTVSGGSRCGDLCRITGKSKASGIYKGHLHHLQQCKNDTGGSDPCDREGGGRGKTTVRLHTGDPCIYGAIREQMDILDEKNIAYDYCPGVSAFCGAASALNLEYTLPDISQSVIITRMEGRTPVPSKESIQSFAAHQATMVVFLSTGMLEELSKRLIEGGYTADTPAAIVYKATWPEQKTFVCTVGTLAKTAAENNITKTALMIIGDTVAAAHYDRSKLYDPEFTTEFREAVKAKTHHS